jgi:CRISPR-associated protein Cas2
VRGEELRTLVIYDVEDDRVRLRVARACRDYGLAHVQYSAFSGPLSAGRRRELCARLADTLGTSPGRLLVVPVCEKDAADAREFFNPPQT